MWRLNFLAISFTCALHIFSYASIPLYKVYPALQDKIAHVVLGDFPTNLQQCPQLSQAFGCTLYCKRDDRAGRLKNDGFRLVGGNKVRKLEFVLADALRKEADHIITFGCAGSNHALATSVYAKSFNMATTCFLHHQPRSWVVQRNLLLQKYYGATLYSVLSKDERVQATELCKTNLFEKTGKEPYIIPVGASFPLGVLGFINAVFELQEQIIEGQMPLPDFIYVPAGSFGTAVGLLIGLQLIDYPSQVVAVAVSRGNCKESIRALFEETKEFLSPLCESFNVLQWNEEQLIVHDSFYGDGYGCPTQSGTDALTLFNTCEKIILEDTYSAKAAAALVSDAQNEKLRNKVVLFWLTFFADSCNELCETVSFEDLPKEFHTYFQ